MKTHGKKTTGLILASVLLLAACSTQPKNTGDVYDLRKQAESHLDLGNKLSDRGDNAEALRMITEAQRLAKITDDPSLIIRTSLSRGNVLMNIRQFDEASQEFESALAESLRMGNRELVAVSRIHISRYRLNRGLSPAQQVKQELAGELGFIKSDTLYIAFAWLVSGLAEKELGNYAEAEAAVKRALNLHEKGRYLEQAAYDWYLIGSFRSSNKDYSGAREALTQALALDRRIENSYGLATDWRALGNIYAKAGNAEESRAAYLRAADIFRALGNADSAEEAEGRIQDGR